MLRANNNQSVLSLLLTKHNQWYRVDRPLYWRTVLHGAALAHHAGLALYAPATFERGQLDPRFRVYETFTPLLLTIWNMIFQVTYLSMSLWLDMAEWRGDGGSERALRLRDWRDTIFSALVVPFSLIVSVLFWLLYHVDREQVFPAALDSVVPAWLNHALHTNILLIVLLEIALHKRSEPVSHAHNLTVCWCFTVLYSVCFFTVYATSGLWLYPVFASLSPLQICLFQLAIFLCMHLFYHSQWPLVALLHGNSAGQHSGGQPSESCSQRSGLSIDRQVVDEIGSTLSTKKYS